MAELTADTEKLYKWAVKTLNQLDRTSTLFSYLCICSTYLVKDYLPDKK